VATQIRVSLEALPIAARQVWKLALEKGKEHLLRARLQEDRSRAERCCPGGLGGRAYAVQILLAICNQREDRVPQYSHANVRIRQFADRRQPELRTRRKRLQRPG